MNFHPSFANPDFIFHTIRIRSKLTIYCEYEYLINFFLESVGARFTFALHTEFGPSHRTYSLFGDTKLFILRQIIWFPNCTKLFLRMNQKLSIGQKKIIFVQIFNKDLVWLHSVLLTSSSSLRNKEKLGVFGIIG